MSEFDSQSAMLAQWRRIRELAQNFLRASVHPPQLIADLDIGHLDEIGRHLLAFAGCQFTQLKQHLLERRGGSVEDCEFPSRVDRACHMSTRQYARLVD